MSPYLGYCGITLHSEKNKGFPSTIKISSIGLRKKEIGHGSQHHLFISVNIDHKYPE